MTEMHSNIFLPEKMCEHNQGLWYSTGEGEQVMGMRAMSFMGKDPFNQEFLQDGNCGERKEPHLGKVSELRE